MADDRLDDAIDAVVRAVDRIERATRGQRPDAELAEAADLRTPSTSVSPGPDAWGAPSGKKKGKKKKRRSELSAEAIAQAQAAGDELVDDGAAGFSGPPAWPEPADAAYDAAADDEFAAPFPPEGAGFGLGSTASSGAAGWADFAPQPPSQAPAEVHELVGRIVARTQELDDHLEAARLLRGEINELVARLAAAATQQR